jgi:hypothetical protein
MCRFSIALHAEASFDYRYLDERALRVSACRYSFGIADIDEISIKPSILR